MKRLLPIILIFCLTSNSFALENEESCRNWIPGAKSICNRWNALWKEGNTDLFVTLFAWHNRNAYTHAKIKTFNENAWGGGLGKSMYDEWGNWHSIYAVAFMDSHNHLEPMAGYMWLKMFSPTENIKFGAGLSVFVTSRPDILNGIPFPGALPWAALVYRNVALHVTYIPGSRGNGNVLFFGARYSFNS